MFCPEGYKTIQEVVDTVLIFQWSAEKYPHQTYSDALENIVFDTIIGSDALRICSPDGVVLKISDEILDKIDIFDFLPADSFPSQHFYEFIGSRPSEIHSFSMPLFFERQNYSISLKNYREYKKVALKKFSEDELHQAVCLPFEKEVFWHLVEKLEGYSLCAVEEKLPRNILNPVGDLQTFLSRKRGRKPTGAKAEYFRRYPERKPLDISYEAIAAELGQAGFPISTRQVQNYEKERRNS